MPDTTAKNYRLYVYYKVAPSSRAIAQAASSRTLSELENKFDLKTEFLQRVDQSGAELTFMEMVSPTQAMPQGQFDEVIAAMNKAADRFFRELPQVPYRHIEWFELIE